MYYSRAPLSASERSPLLRKFGNLSIREFWLWRQRTTCRPYRHLGRGEGSQESVRPEGGYVVFSWREKVRCFWAIRVFLGGKSRGQIVVVSWQLSKQGICWPVSHDRFSGSGVDPWSLRVFLKLSADKLLVFKWSQTQFKISTNAHCISCVYALHYFKPISDAKIQPVFKADTHERFCPRSMLQVHFVRVSTHERAFSSLPLELAPKYLTG